MKKESQLMYNRVCVEVSRLCGSNDLNALVKTLRSNRRVVKFVAVGSLLSQITVPYFDNVTGIPEIFKSQQF